MNFYPISNMPFMSYNSSPVPPVTKVPEIKGALQTKTVAMDNINKSKGTDTAFEVLGNGDFAINNMGIPAGTYGQGASIDELTYQRVWSA